MGRDARTQRNARVPPIRKGSHGDSGETGDKRSSCSSLLECKRGSVLAFFSSRVNPQGPSAGWTLGLAACASQASRTAKVSFALISRSMCVRVFTEAICRSCMERGIWICESDVRFDPQEQAKKRSKPILPRSLCAELGHGYSNHLEDGWSGDGWTTERGRGGRSMEIRR